MPSDVRGNVSALWSLLERHRLKRMTADSSSPSSPLLLVVWSVCLRGGWNRGQQGQLVGISSSVDLKFTTSNCPTLYQCLAHLTLANLPVFLVSVFNQHPKCVLRAPL